MAAANHHLIMLRACMRASVREPQSHRRPRSLRTNNKLDKVQRAIARARFAELSVFQSFQVAKYYCSR